MKKSFNKVIIMGNLVRDPELTFLPSGTAACNFSIASNDSYKKDDDWVEQVSYIDVVVFSRQAENCNEYLSKGRSVLIEGRLQQRRWEAKDGTKRSKVEIAASNVVFLGSGKDNGSGDSEVVNDTDVPF
jgi:single-strand DNA-binding protein